MMDASFHNSFCILNKCVFCRWIFLGAVYTLLLCRCMTLVWFDQRERSAPVRSQAKETAVKDKDSLEWQYVKNPFRIRHITCKFATESLQHWKAFVQCANLLSVTGHHIIESAPWHCLPRDETRLLLQRFSEPASSCSLSDLMCV